VESRQVAHEEYEGEKCRRRLLRSAGAGDLPDREEENTGDDAGEHTGSQDVGGEADRGEIDECGVAVFALRPVPPHQQDDYEE
jgi:hypothetical protein